MRLKGKTFLLFSLTPLLFSCDPDSQVLFPEVSSSKSGISFENKLSPTQEWNILTYLYYYNGGGVGSADFNGDGLLDLYFVGNQDRDHLYLNNGDLTFSEISEQAGITNTTGWSNGVSIVDINGDRLPDIYVSKVGAYKNIEGRNLLYINKGVDEEGIPRFIEQAEEYNLDLVGFSSQAVFFDYDQDGDLDMYQLNHSVHPNRSYGKGSKRTETDDLAGDKLLENREGKYVDVSYDAGIFQGNIGYGLGVSVGDLNCDGYPDLYVGNDFFENDYLYLNQGNGTFVDIISMDNTVLGHTSHYSMGNSIADVNNDGLLDIVSLDMLPEDIETYKSSGGEDPYPIYSYYLRNGYAPQYIQNTLHLNRGSMTFNEIAHLSGIASTEWSWSVLVNDFDLDGMRDIHITNGILGATNDMDFVSFIAQDKIQRAISRGTEGQSLEFTQQLPSKKVRNYTYKNLGKATFKNVSNTWFNAEPGYSAGSIYADLDNDGDDDIIINNTNGIAQVYENTIEENGSNYISVDYEGDSGNTFGIGVKCFIYCGNLQLLDENYPVRSYLSSVPPISTFGLGSATQIDSIQVVWPGGKFETVYDIPSNQKITFDESNAKGDFYTLRKIPVGPLINSDVKLDFRHLDPLSYEFDREPLIPFSKGNEGPSISVGDINDDGLDDIFIGGAKRQNSALFTQTSEGTFQEIQTSTFQPHSNNEDTDHEFFDADNDGDQDLIVVSGGNEFQNGIELQPRLYVNQNGQFRLIEGLFGNIEVHASVVKCFDFDGDGDLDILIGSNTVPWEFGANSRNYLLENLGDLKFADATDSLAPKLKDVGLIEDVVIIDFDNNGHQDLIMAGYWMPVTILFNDGSFIGSERLEMPASEGWWNCLEIADFDKDGDLDIVAGNWGLNTRLKASEKEPIRLYRNDFDDNGKVDPILSYIYQGKETTLALKDELVKQLPILNKKYLSYKSFAESDFQSVFDNSKLQESELLHVYELASCFFKNEGNNNFEKQYLPRGAQVSSVHDIAVDDINGDGYLDMMLVGNTWEISTQLGRLDASHGTLLLNDQKGYFTESVQSFNVNGPARNIKRITIDDKIHYMVSINNDRPIFLTTSDLK